MAVTAPKQAVDMAAVLLVVATVEMPVATVVEPQQVDMGEDLLVEVVMEEEQNQKEVMEELPLEVTVVALQLADMEEVVVEVDMVQKQLVDMVVTPVGHLVDTEGQPVGHREDTEVQPVEQLEDTVALQVDTEEKLEALLEDMEEQLADHPEDTVVQLGVHPEDTGVDPLEVGVRNMLFS